MAQDSEPSGSTNGLNLNDLDLGSVNLDGLELERYDFDGLRNDIADIVDVQQAVLTTLKWTLLIPLIGTIVAWFIFDDRISAWLFYPYMAILVATMVLAAINVGLMFVLRNRIAETNQAADRVLGMTAAIHSDYLKVQSGEVELPIKEIAGVVTRELVFPALFGAGHNMIATATTAAGPVGWFGARLLKYPIAAVEKRVLEVLDSPELDELTTAVEPGFDERIDGSEIVAAALVPTLGDADLDGWYGQAHDIIHRVVSGVSTVATGSLGTVLFFAALPLVGWLALGWYVL